MLLCRCYRCRPHRLWRRGLRGERRILRGRAGKPYELPRHFKLLVLWAESFEF
jgi:hypothetical protein